MDQGLNLTEAKRKLASIVTIKSLKPIAKADKIEIAKVLGWDVVVKKGAFKVGEKVVFFAIDSFLPNEERYSFLGSVHRNPITIHTNHVETGHRVSTVKLRGQISQGLVMPLSEFGIEESIEIGADVSEVLGVTKYAKPEVKSNFGSTLGDFPTWLIDKTDEVRIQDMPESFTKLKDQPYYMTYKYDGTSITVARVTDESTGEPKLIVASRNKTLKEGSTIHKWLDENGITDRLLNFHTDVVLQGEFYGDKIQGNKLGIEGNRWAIFNVEIDRKRLGLKRMESVTAQLNLETVKVFEYGDPFEYSQAELLDMANNLKYPNGTYAEGLVVRPFTPDKNKYSFKVISNNFLLKYKA